MLTTDFFRTYLIRNPRLLLAAGAVALYLVALLLLSRAVGIGAAALTPIPVIVVAVAGHMHNLRQRVKRELLTRELAEEELCRSDHRYQTLVDTAPDIIYRLGIDGMITSLNPAFENITGRPVDEVIGRPFVEIIHPEDVHLAREGFEHAALHGRTSAPVELRVRAKNGEYLTGEFSSAPLFENGQLVGNFGVARDVTGRKRAEEKLRHVAYYDALTGLPNRELFLDRLHQAIIQARRYKRMLAVMLLDIDRFKEINDTLGHRTGDLLLRAVADRINRCVREGDTVARHGGDEFIILFSGVSHIQDMVVVAKKVNRALSEGSVLNGQELFITASMGISLYPADGIDADTLVKNADVAMYQAKGHGRNTYRFYTPTMNAEALRKLILENNLRKALEREEFVLHYQPLVELATGRVTGTEALLRWQHPGLGLLAPIEFIPLAEETGLIVPIGEWMLQKACEQGKAWQEAGRPSLRMAVNLSMRQFRQNNVTEMVAGALMRSGLHPGCLDLELTESVVMQDAEETIATLRELKSLGVRLTIDDFGTGYSSLSYLKNLPLSTLKLDQSFVNALTRDRGDEAISRAIVALAHDLSLKVIAEGVETSEQVEFLRVLKCDEVQGFLFSRPVPAPELSGIIGGDSPLAA